MSKRRVTSVLLFVLPIAFGVAWAHHSTANFDMTKQLTVAGVVTSFEFMNPHSLIKLDVTGADGAANNYSVFATSRSVLIRYGWRPESVKPGDKITVTGALDRQDPHHMYLLKITFADGKEWGRDEIAQ